MNYANIKPIDIADGPGVRVSLFVSGCTHFCPGCFNAVAWDFEAGKPFTDETENELLRLLSPDYITGLTLLGGEPMEKPNQTGLFPFLQRLKKELPGKTIWLYSGYTFEELTNRENLRTRTDVTDELLQMCDVLVDGRFVEAEKDITLRFKGSKNQRIIDLKQTLTSGKITLWEDEAIYASHELKK